MKEELQTSLKNMIFYHHLFEKEEKAKAEIERKLLKQESENYCTFIGKTLNPESGESCWLPIFSRFEWDA